jgi:hypothetical protein
MAGKNVTINFKGNSKSAESAIDKVSKSLKNMSSSGGKGAGSLAGLASSAVPMVAAAGAAVAAVKKVGQAINEMTEAYEKQRKSEIQLEVAARNNPYLNSSSVMELKDYASQLQSIGTIGDEELLPMMAKLAAAGRTQEEIQSIMSASLDISAGGMVSMETAVDALSKTLDGQSTALGKIVPQVKSLTTEQLKNGDAIRQAADAYAGMSEEVTKATGSTQQLKNAWGDFKENLGEGFSKIISPIKNMFTGLLTGINTAVSGAKSAFNQIKTINDYRSGKLDPNSLDSGSMGKIYEQAKYDYSSSYQRAKGLKETFAQQIQDWGVEAMQDIVGLTDSDGNTGLAAVQALINKAAAGNKSPILLKNLDDFIKTGNASNNQIQLSEAIHDMIASLAERDKTQREYKAALDKEAAAVKEAEDKAWEAEVTEAKRKADDAIAAAKTLNDLKKQNGLLTDAGYNDAMYNAVWSAYETMVTASTAPSKMESEFEAGQILQQLAAYSDRTEKEIKYTANKTSSTKDKAPKTMEDWIKTIIDAVSGARQTVDAKRSMGESVSENEEEDTLADAAYKAIVKVLSEPEFLESQGKDGSSRLLSDNTIKGYLKMIEDSAKRSGFEEKKGELSEAINGFWEETGERTSSEIKNAARTILDAHNEVEKYHELSLAEQQAYNEEMEKLEKELADTAYEGGDVQSVYDRMLECQARYHQLSVDDEALYNETMKQLAKELREAEQRELMESVQEKMSMADDLIQGLGDSALKAGDMVAEYLENTRTAEVAEARKQYEDGAMSYEEYCERVDRLDKDMAQEKYKVAMAMWAIQLAQATANIAQGVTKAIAEGGTMGIINGILVSSAGAVNIASIVASKPKPPSFSGGGIVPGTSYTGDRVQANVNSGEMVLNARQQKALWTAANGGGASGMQLKVVVNNSMADKAHVDAGLDNGQVRIMVNEIVSSEMARGTYTPSMQEAESRSKGVRYL